MGTLTVRENLHFSAALRLPGKLSKREREERVDATLSDLGLFHVAESKVRLVGEYGNKNQNFRRVVDRCYYASTNVAGFTRVFGALPRIRFSGGFEGWQYR